MLKEFDIVRATRKLSELVLKDCKGTILSVFYSPSIAYYVEFFNEDSEHLELLIVKEEDIKKRKE